MVCRIRPATFAELPLVVDLAVEMVLASRSELRPEVSDLAILQARRRNLGTLEELLELPEGAVLVAVNERDAILGHVIVMGNQIDTVSELPQAWVYDLSVRPEFWGQGIGRALMEAAEEFARSLGLEWIGLGVTVANHRAVRFYEEIGYEKERFQMIKRLPEETA